MFNSIISLCCAVVCVVLILSSVSVAVVPDVKWDNGGPDNLWSTVSNWDPNTVPIATDVIGFDVNDIDSALIDSSVTAIGEALYVGFDSGVGGLDMTGGTLSLSGDMSVGYFDIGAGTASVDVSGGTLELRDLYIGFYDSGTLNYSNAMMSARYLYLGIRSNSIGVMNMDSGTVTLSSRLRVGYTGNGTLNMNGGSITATSRATEMGLDGGVGHIQLDGGTIQSTGLSIAAGCSVDITGGTFLLNGDDVVTINDYATADLITAFNGIN